MEKKLIVSDKEFIDKLISMGYTKKKAEAIAKSRKAFGKSLVDSVEDKVPEKSTIITRINEYYSK